MNRRTAAAVSALALSPLLFLTTPSQATVGSCTLTLPAKVVINSPSEIVATPISGDCLAVADMAATWRANKDGWYSTIMYDTMDEYPASDYEMEYPDDLPLGTWTYLPRGAVDIETDSTYSQNTARTSVRLGTKTSLSATRLGNYVTLKARATVYDPATDTSKPIAGKLVKFSQKIGDGAWTARTEATTGADGYVTVKLYASTARSWKASIGSTSTTWSSYRTTTK